MAEESVINVSKSTNGPALVISVSGKVDALTSPEFKKHLADAVGQNPKVICDMAGVTYISSAGVGALIENKNNAGKAGGDIVLCSLIPDVKKVFDLLGFSKFFKIYADQKEAVGKI